jgi:hypothetical protein
MSAFFLPTEHHSRSFVIMPMENATQQSFEHLRRLRQDKKICGYARIEQGVVFYSRDMFWWRGEAIPHNERDQYSGYTDQKQRRIFEHDLIALERKGWFKRVKDYYAVVMTPVGFILQGMHGNKSHPIAYLDTILRWEWAGYAFLLPQHADAR